MALYSQSAEEDVIRLKAGQEVEAVESGNVETKKGLENGSWNLLVGTRFSYMKGYGSGNSILCLCIPETMLIQIPSTNMK